jgi:hypothetical protein
MISKKNLQLLCDSFRDASQNPDNIDMLINMLQVQADVFYGLDSSEIKQIMVKVTTNLNRGQN